MSEPAPPGLELVRQFVNTHDIEDARDTFATLEGFRQWCTANLDGPTGQLRATELADAMVIREGIRALVIRAAARDDDFAAAIDRLRLSVVFRDGGLVSVGETPLGKLLAPLLDALRTAQADGTFDRLKACQRDSCRWLFYDRTRNRSAHWCTTNLCGSREKAKRAYYRARTRTTD